MKSFEAGRFERLRLPASLVSVARRLGELRATHDARVAEQVGLADTLHQAAFLRSIETFSRLEGALIAPERVQAIVASGEAPETRAEQEVAGYRDALAAVDVDLAGAPFAPAALLALHALLFRFVPGGGGRWKESDDLVVEALADGSTSVVFTPVPAYAVEDALNRLHDGFTGCLAAGIGDPLLLVPAYLLDFFCIHPFAEGNERMVRLLATLLARRAGYRAVRFVSMDQLFERTRGEWSAALHASWRGWHQGKHDLAPWCEYFLGVLLAAGEAFEQDMAVSTLPRGAKRDMVLDAVERLPREFRYADLVALVPSVSRPTINRALRRLRAARVVACVKPGRSARWQRL